MQVESELQDAPSLRAAGASPVGSWELHPGDDCLTCSLDARRIFGLGAGTTSATPEALAALAVPADAMAVRAAFGQALTTASPLDLEYSIAVANGAERHVHLRADYVAGELGQPPRLWGSVQDVTDRPRISSALRESEIARVEAEEARARAIAESEERFRQLADNIQEVFWLWGVAQDAFIYISPAFETIWQRRCAEVYASPRIWASYIHADDRTAVVSALPRRATGEYDEEYRIVRPDGSVRWISDRAFPVRDAQGNVDRIAGVAQDITDRREAQEAIQRIATGLSTTLESITDAFYTLDEHWRFTYVNHEAERLMQRARAELLGRSVWDAFPEAVDTEFHRQFQRAVRENASVRFDDFYPPLECWFEVRAFPSPQGLAVYFLDVTERRRVLEELQRSAEALRQRTQQLDIALDAARLGAWSWDLDTNLVTTIQGEGPACGLPEGIYPSTGEAFKELVHPDDRTWVMERLQAAADDGTDYRAEFRIRSSEGGERWIASHGQWTRDADGRHRVMVGADLDITDRRRAADELRAFALRLESAQDAERSTIAREVHDELGQALTVLRMDATRLAKLSAANPALAELVREMTEVIDSTLQRTRSIAIALHPSALDDLGLAAAIEIHANHIGRRTSLEISLDLQQVSDHVDRGRARAAYRVFQESLTNVIRHAEATHVAVRLAENASELVLEVEDDGCGITPEQLTGAGSLGLLGMRERAAAFGGHVAFAEVEPCGTRVTLHLPLRP